MKGGMNKLMQQAQMLQDALAKAQEELETLEVEATAGGGAVTVTASGRGDILAIRIAPEAITPDDPETLEDLILAGVSAAIEKSRVAANEHMQQVTGGILPPGMNLPGM
jgi:DNA-binding YbaB/EbfC family protein